MLIRVDALLLVCVFAWYCYNCADLFACMLLYGVSFVLLAGGCWGGVCCTCCVCVFACFCCCVSVVCFLVLRDLFFCLFVLCVCLLVCLCCCFVYVLLLLCVLCVAYCRLVCVWFAVFCLACLLCVLRVCLSIFCFVSGGVVLFCVCCLCVVCVLFVLLVLFVLNVCYCFVYGVSFLCVAGGCSF